MKKNLKQEPTGGSLESVLLKLARAGDHLDELQRIDSEFANVEVQMPFVRDEKRQIGFFEVRLPNPPKTVATIVGDCLHNLRASLDYLVWQLVYSNPPNTPGKNNMFPICQAASNFEELLRKGRLDGLEEKAVEAVRSLQPLDLPQHPLVLLNDLYNADKHRDLHVVVAVASDLDVVSIRNGEIVMRTILSGEEVRHGEPYGGIGMPLSKVPHGIQMRVLGSAVAYMAFKDLISSEEGEQMPVVSTMRVIRDFLIATVVPTLAPMIR